MTEIEKIEYAKSFIDKLANGINPLNDTPVPDSDIVNNVRLSRCFFYVSEILRQVIDNGGTSVVRSERKRKKEFALSEEDYAKIQTSDLPVSVSEIAKQLNSFVDTSTTKTISASSINNWLVEIGLLETIDLANGKHRKTPTQQGKDFGIFTENRIGQYGPYISVLFTSQAQQFIYDNIDSLVASKQKTDSAQEHSSHPWTKDHDDCLIDLFQKSVSISEIAITLKRSEGGIRARLKKLGLIYN